jgi:hypothetical protein
MAEEPVAGFFPETYLFVSSENCKREPRDVKKDYGNVILAKKTAEYLS